MDRSTQTAQSQPQLLILCIASQQQHDPPAASLCSRHYGASRMHADAWRVSDSGRQSAASGVDRSRSDAAAASRSSRQTACELDSAPRMRRQKLLAHWIASRLCALLFACALVLRLHRAASILLLRLLLRRCSIIAASLRCWSTAAPVSPLQPTPALLVLLLTARRFLCRFALARRLPSLALRSLCRASTSRTTSAARALTPLAPSRRSPPRATCVRISLLSPSPDTTSCERRRSEWPPRSRRDDDRARPLPKCAHSSCSSLQEARSVDGMSYEGGMMQ